MKRVRLDYTNVIRKSEYHKTLFSLEEIGAIRADIEQAHRELKEERLTKDELSFLALPYAYHQAYTHTPKNVFADTLWEDKEKIEQKAGLIRRNCSDYVQIAIGGSALGAIALTSALGHGLDPCEQQSCYKIHMPDNVDPEWIDRILRSIQVEKSFFAVISNSGQTVETLANFFIFYNALKTKVAAEQLKERVVVMTNPASGALAGLCKGEGFTLIRIPASVCGRFSVLSPAGLFTAAVSGVVIDELLEGARVMDELTDELAFWDNPMLIYASIHYLANVQKNIDTLVLMPYSQGLRTIADWYSQLVAESLGKDGKGITPVKALGATDQHSQLQLYNQGPKNKLVTFFCVDKHRRFVEIPSEFASCEDFRYLWGHSLNQLLDSEQKATAISLFNNGVPNCSLRIPKVSSFYLGQLLILLEKVVCVLGKLYKVNAFNQPGVEESKEYARAMLGKKGGIYEKKRSELAFYSDPDELRVI